MDKPGRLHFFWVLDGPALPLPDGWTCRQMVGEDGFIQSSGVEPDVECALSPDFEVMVRYCRMARRYEYLELATEAAVMMLPGHQDGDLDRPGWGTSFAYYTDRAGGPSRREQRDAELTAKIIEIHDESTQTYGSPRVHRELLDQGHRCSRKRITRPMQAADRHGRIPRRWNKTTIPDPDAAHRPDLIGRDFDPDPNHPGQLDRRWCGGIT